MHRHRLLSARLPCAALAVLGLLFATGVSIGCTPGTADPTPPGSATVRPVEVAEVERAPAAEGLRLPGTLRASQRARLAFFHAGVLAARPVRLGQQVAAGERLASLRNPSLQPGVLAAEAAEREARETAAQLERDVERLEELAARQLIAEEEVERARSRRDGAREALARAQATLADARDQFAEASLRAPFAGVITDVHVEPGDFVAAGQPVLDIVDPQRLELRLELPAGWATNLRPGQAVRVQRLADGAAVQAVVREIGGAAPGRALPILVALPEATPWAPGEPVHAFLEITRSEILLVPMAAIIDPGTGNSRVFRVRENRAERIAVQLGALQGDRVGVVGELAPGDTVIVAGHAMLLDGEAVRILP
ncbi:MAG: efflux RND transporter periplasmic adaptor subunit [Gammaproteobacteria bacterium]|nr:efflux RND transporter periplasmic adaptor subunit [Gammaproteobacteria bacterium]TVQ48334.1 MAG: efflux RND transporter periplasmic adaptor subunit [Gammaproteobacteria bacterium]